MDNGYDNLTVRCQQVLTQVEVANVSCRATERENELRWEWRIKSAMPTEVLADFDAQDATELVARLSTDFGRGSTPVWFTSLSTRAQTYFMTRWMGYLRDVYDVQGTSLATLKALEITTVSGSVPTVVEKEEAFT